jgi:hypothetical protein
MQDTTMTVTPLEDILKFDSDEPRLTRAQERQRDFFSALRHLFYLGRDGVATFTASSDQPISDGELYSAANNSTIRDVHYYRDRAVMLWERVIRDARDGRRC